MQIKCHGPFRKWEGTHTIEKHVPYQQDKLGPYVLVEDLPRHKKFTLVYFPFPISGVDFLKHPLAVTEPTS